MTIQFYKFNVKVISPKHKMLIVPGDDFDEAYEKAKHYLKDNKEEWSKQDEGYPNDFKIELVECDEPVDEDQPELHELDDEEFQDYIEETQDYEIVE